VRASSRFLIAVAAAAGLTGCPLASATALGQAPAADSLFQLEVTDSIGLPLPNAKLELFTYMPGGIWREWVAIEPYHLEPGMHLLRFSHEGYRPAVLSVPLEKGRRASLRVRLNPERPTPERDAIEATEPRAIGLVLDGRNSRDFIGLRRVIERAAIEQAKGARVSEILRRAKHSNLVMIPGSGGGFSIRVGGRNLCRAGVLLNGNPTLTLSFARFEEMYWSSDPEAIEIVERGTAIPYWFRRSELGDCSMLLVWLRGR
jgi:hypothetical protein